MESEGGKKKEQTQNLIQKRQPQGGGEWGGTVGQGTKRRRLDWDVNTGQKEGGERGEGDGNEEWKEKEEEHKRTGGNNRRRWQQKGMSAMVTKREFKVGQSEEGVKMREKSEAWNVKWDAHNTTRRRWGKRKRTNEEIRRDSHSVLTENRGRRGLLIKRYWILVTLHSICWQLCSCAAAWNPILKGWFRAVLPLELQ